MPSENTLPINPRYDGPMLDNLRPFLGYQNFYQMPTRVEIANLHVLHQIGVIPKSDFKSLTPKMEKQLLGIQTSVVDDWEKKTHHDIRALVKAMNELLGNDLGRWLHVPLTSYDTLSTAYALLFRQMHFEVIKPRVSYLIQLWAEQVKKYASVAQIGRTHLQHAMPVTVGFWLATILDRVVYCMKQADHFAGELRGKISGAVGAYNAQEHLGINARCGGAARYEELILERLGLKPYPISTQIAPPEPLSQYLFSLVMLSGALGQFAEDARKLVQSEVGELVYPLEVGQDGSSTMAQKINPILFENICGGFVITKNIFGMVLDSLQSDFQRDLRWSSVSREFGGIPTKVLHQVETLLKLDKKTMIPLIVRIEINPANLQKNLRLAGDSVLAEPAYIALIMAGYRGEAHSVVRDAIRSEPYQQGKEGLLLAIQNLALARDDENLTKAWENIPAQIKDLFSRPQSYTGLAEDKACQIAEQSLEYAH